MTKKLILSISLLILMASVRAQSLTVYRTDLKVDEACEKVINIITESKLLYFETVAHDKIAAERGQKIEPTRSILFEDPDLTTKLISCQQTTAIDLPLEILVWEEHGDVYLGYIDPKFMKKRFMVMGCDETIESLTRLMVKITNDAIRK